MKIALACDHGAYDLKQEVMDHLGQLGHTWEDFGTYSLDSCDYPDFCIPAARAVAEGSCDRGIVLCTTGIGMCITANKIPGIRCALCHDLMSAELTRRHNNTNMLAMGAGVVGTKLALQILDTWLMTEFEGGRHQRRIDKISALES